MSKSLWSKLIDDAKTVVDKMKAPYVESSTKRKFQSAIDDAETKIIDLRNTILDEYQKLDKMNLAVIVTAKHNIANYQEAIATLKDVQNELFES